MLLLKRKMGPRKGRRMRKIEFPRDTPTEFELGDTATDIQRKKEGREEREGEEEAQKQQMEEREEVRRE